MRSRALKTVLIALSLLAGAAAVGWAQDPPPSPSPNAPAPYRLGVEDVLRIFIWGEPELSGRYQVRPDGKISVPLVQDLPVLGQTVDEVRRTVTAALSQYIRDPNVTVIVEAINSYRVYFLGEVGRQGAVEFYRPTRLIQGIAAAGGLTAFAKKEITLIREEDGVEKRIAIDYKRLISGDPAQENFHLLPGDTLIFH
jgi:polysaccharide export outer membrane protein